MLADAARFEGYDSKLIRGNEPATLSRDVREFISPTDEGRDRPEDPPS